MRITEIFLNLPSITKAICEIAGHRWRYIDYSNYMKANGDKYDFKASRCCARCDIYEYFVKDWVAQPKSSMDYESKYFAVKKITIKEQSILKANAPKNIMKEDLTPGKYKAGEIVYAVSNPDLKLVVRKYIDRIYYCNVKEDLSAKERVYFERELL